jgi:hypothetical protein
MAEMNKPRDLGIVGFSESIDVLKFVWKNNSYSPIDRYKYLVYILFKIIIIIATVFVLAYLVLDSIKLFTSGARPSITGGLGVGLLFAVSVLLILPPLQSWEKKKYFNQYRSSLLGEERAKEILDKEEDIQSEAIIKIGEQCKRNIKARNMIGIIALACVLSMISFALIILLLSQIIDPICEDYHSKKEISNALSCFQNKTSLALLLGSASFLVIVYILWKMFGNKKG